VGAVEPAISQECVEAYVFCTGPTRVLLLRRPPARGRIWVPVSGKVEPTDADYPAALRRELDEETGFREFVRVFALEWDVPFDGPDGRRWRLHAFGVELEGALPPRMSAEHEEFEWTDPARAVERLHYEDNREAVRRLVHVIERSDAESPPNV
jgi:8-oxo-dGTP pyrophosphatase MutT (NUDIX family)